jgi:predicted DNA-binding transcriptional regulator AlpA
MKAITCTTANLLTANSGLMVNGLLDERRCAQFLGCSVALVQRWRLYRKGGPRFVKLGKLVRYALADLEAYIAANTISPVDREPMR